MQARYYDPILGRFYGNDPVGFQAGTGHSFNRYAYVANNPYVYNDPNGEWLNFAIGGALGALEDIAFQGIMMALGAQDEFSYSSVAMSTGLGVATSGVSAYAQGGRLAMAAGKLGKKILGKGDDVTKTAEARAARDVLSESAAKLSNNKRPATVTAGYNTKTGEVAARACGGGKCAEDHVVDALGGNKANVRFTEAVRPRTGEQVPVCTRCEGNFGREPFPSGTTRFKSDQ